MKLPSLLAVALLPLGLLAAPVVDDDAGNIVARDADDAINLRTRSTVICQLQSDSNAVNCYAGPSVSSGVVRSLGMASSWKFTCAKTGQCVTVRGKVDCGWYFSPDIATNGCYINGHNMRDDCNTALLGWC